ncbi:copper-binding protein [Roseovarius nanhaiticus]|uniref:copper-binding protein n=1 Tax=Roseovarius nanhaiticus TaxID=573024 RepID=UPI002492671B|nr:copper-binding protein [Roseovarius nanhaiticus]
MKPLLLTLALGMLAAPALAQTGSEMDHSKMDHSEMNTSAEQMDGAVHTKATINSLGDGTANVSHEPIPEIGWPAMTMDLTVTQDAQMMGDIAEGDTVNLMLIKGADGMYTIGGMMAE